MASDSNDIETLNVLATTLVDSIHGYRNAAANDFVGGFKDFFLDHAGDRQHVLDSLRETVVELGGNPVGDDPSLLGRAHRGWLGLKSVILAHDVKAILNEVERGEHFLKEKFEAALDDESLSGSARLAVQQAYQSVRKGHEEICRIRRDVE
jgi:uncharacterized protein (TIGR02284 family)